MMYALINDRKNYPKDESLKAALPYLPNLKIDPLLKGEVAQMGDPIKLKIRREYIQKVVPSLGLDSSAVFDAPFTDYSDRESRIDSTRQWHPKDSLFLDICTGIARGRDSTDWRPKNVSNEVETLTHSELVSFFRHHKARVLIWYQDLNYMGAPTFRKKIIRRIRRKYPNLAICLHIFRSYFVSLVYMSHSKSTIAKIAAALPKDKKTLVVKLGVRKSK